MPMRELGSIVVLVHVVSFCFGCIVGSFLNVVVWRVPRGESLLSPPSHCPNCGHEIRPWENIPIISWLVLRARCSGCGLPISIRYPLGEGATGILFWLVALAAFRRNLPLAWLPGAFYLTGSLLAASLIDLKHRLIPNLITYSGLVVSIVLALLIPQGRISVFSNDAAVSGGLLVHSAIRGLAGEFQADLIQMPAVLAMLDWALGAALGFAILGSFSVLGTKVFKSPLMGMGDVKLLAMIGGFLGADAVLFTTLFGSLTGLFFGLVRRYVFRSSDLSVAFGLFLSLGAFVWILFGGSVWEFFHKVF
jgi:leader peptidase (prepilin peptidase)/N-methyltransferase